MNQPSQFKEEIDFRDLLRSPRKMFGFSYFYFFGLLLLLGMMYAWNLNAIGNNSAVPLVLADSSAFVQDIPMQSPSVLPPVDVKTVAHPTQELLSRGRELFKGNCASCHGDNGAGDGPSGLLLNPRPRNFHQASGWTNGAKVSEMYRTLQEGIAKNGMPSFSYLAPADRFALIHVVRSFHPAPPADSAQEIAQLETTYQLSKGSVVPAQIPIRDAIKHIAAEAKPREALLKSRATHLGNAVNEPGVASGARYVSNPLRFLVACAARRDSLGTTERFIRAVSSDPAAFGVKPGIVVLSAGEWAAFHEFALREVE
jgi:mono/diheme cytochrome c family protein